MPLRICFAPAEMVPFAKAGGLGDVAGALVKYLHAAGHDVRLFMPGYSTIDRTKLECRPVEFAQKVPLIIGTHKFQFSLQTARLPGAVQARRDLYGRSGRISPLSAADARGLHRLPAHGIFAAHSALQ